ncbi:MAG: hypothetical protein PHE55_23055 [Methylococcaceae bacterium]|nr:hypothetical protein [Methylococcaceae bacterium]
MEEMVRGWSQNTSYRQGSVLSSDVVVCCLEITNGGQFAVVISHDCDIANNAEKEPFVEVIIAQAISRMDGNCSQAKNPRLLHIEFTRHDQPCSMELSATEKRTISKFDLIDSAPDSSFSLSDSNRQILSRWLAARYRRHAFPDALNRRLGQAFEKNLKKSTDEILAVFIDYQPRNEELPENEPYELWVYVVADTAKLGSIEKAKTVARAFKETLGKQKGLDIVECDAVTDAEFTLADTRRTFEFRLEYLSLRHEPFGAIAEH